jgi:hypothetical protein
MPSNKRVGVPKAASVAPFFIAYPSIRLHIYNSVKLITLAAIFTVEPVQSPQSPKDGEAGLSYLSFRGAEQWP